MRWLLLAALAVNVPAAAQDLLGGAWTSVNDGVMGGVSEGRVAMQDGVLVFEGRVSLENNGGFASVRRATAALNAATLQFKLRVRGDGRRYRLTASPGGPSGAQYAMAFDAPAGSWVEVAVPLAAMRASFRGRPLPDAPPLTAVDVRSVGFIFGEGQSGAFRLEVGALEAR